MKRIELSTSSLPRKCSTPELQRLVKSRDFSQQAIVHHHTFHPLHPITCLTLRGAEDEVRTRDLQLGRLSLYQLSYFRLSTLLDANSLMSTISWARMDSNHRTPKRTDLQSVAVGHLATCPFTRGINPHRAREGIRTPDQLITNQLLYQLSYSGL